MGTRTYSRRAADGSRRLTALGRARTASAGAAPPIPSAIVFAPFEGNSRTLGVNPTDMFRKNVEQIYRSTPESITSFLDSFEGASDKKGRVQRNAIALTAIAMEGTPEQRERAIYLLLVYMWRNAPELETIKLGSMDYLYLTSADPREFIKNFWKRWANYGEVETSRVGWAQLHSYMAEIGPNKGLPYPNDFYPAGRRPIELNPKIVEALQQEYERTQKRLKRKGYPEEGMTLYRGTSQPEGLSMESFTTLEYIANLFAAKGGLSLRAFGSGQVRTEVIPRRFIMGSYNTIPGWPEKKVLGSEEYMVLGTAFYADKGITRDTPASSNSTYITID